MEQLIRLELSQFMAKLKRLPTMDKSRRGRKSMASWTGVPARFSRGPRRGESAEGVLPDLHVIVPVLPAQLLRNFSETKDII